MTAQEKRRLFIPLAILALIGVVMIVRKSPAAAAPHAAAMLPAVDDSKLLQIQDATLTSYLAAATAVQDVSPRVRHRGVGIDGVARSGSTHPMHLGANPFGSPWSANQSMGGIRLATGAFTQRDVDIALPAQGPAWVIGRSYSSRQKDSSGDHTSSGYQGQNWFQTSQPEIVFYDDATTDADDVVYLVYGADAFLEFQRYESGSDEFKGMNGAAGMLEFVDGGDDPDLYVYTDQWGYEFRFFGFDGDAGSAAGQFWKVTDPEGLEAFAGDATLGNDPITLGYDSGKITYAYDSEDRRYTYSYKSSGTNAGKLESVVAETKTGGTWTSPTGVKEVAKVEYEYYEDADTHGSDHDLKIVEITVPLTDSTVSLTKKKYYRYYGDSAFNATTHPGHASEIKMVVDFEGTRNYDYLDSTFDEDFVSETDANLETYSSAMVEYNSSRQVDKAFFGGDCGCGGSGSNGEHEFEYESNGSYSDGTGYDTTWWSRTVVERPNGSYLTQYFDEAGQSLNQVVTDADPDNTSPVPDRWVTAVTRNSDGVVTQVSTPANITGYTHSTGAVTTSTTDGLVWVYVLQTTGDLTGLMLDTQWKDGTSGTLKYQRTVEHATASITPDTTIDVIRPVIDVEKAYHTATSFPGSTDYDQTEHSYTFFTGKLVVEHVETTHPAVSTAQNGSGSSAVSRTQLTEQGAVEWTQGPLGVINKTERANGQIPTYIEDASSASSPPAAWAVSTDAVSRETGYTFDAQGRLASVSRPDGRVEKTYTTKLASELVLELVYADFDEVAGTYYGPVQFTVLNQAGQTEASGIVELTGNETDAAIHAHVDETDADPLTALDLGTVARFSRNVLGDSGTRVMESWDYFEVPAAGDGTEGTHYDATLLGYSDTGMLNRRKDPSGTIYRTNYDVLGRVTSREIGTNDAEEAGGDDMVVTELLEYDEGGDDGNGLLTKSTSRVEDDSDNERVTEFEYDAKGNRILTLGPEAPFVLVKVDNLGRPVAEGLYGSKTGLDTGDNPTSLATNRLALSQTFYNETSRIWKRQVHNIDAANGSDDGNLQTLVWYDATGRTIKVDGDELAKTKYDRLGRTTHEFLLAEDDDTGYADADDVAGDIVLLEHQTVYESSDSDDVVIQATIRRHHDDKGAGETTGALDLNSETPADPLKYTSSDVLGRIQITAHWHDRFGRLTDSVEYGTYGGSTFDRDGLAVPTRSDTELLTEYAYGIDGTVESATDPMGRETRWTYDELGRATTVIANYIDGTPSGDTDVHTLSVYENGLRTKRVADLDGDGEADPGDRQTIYRYGTTFGTAEGDSMIATGHLLQEVEYPDSTGAADVVTYAYNAQEQQDWRKDQAGYIIERSFDGLGRRTDETVANADLVSGFNEDVLRISSAYDSLGRVTTVTQYDAVTGGAVLDQTKYTYGDWGKLTKIEQDNDSAVGGASGNGAYSISYTWEKATSGPNMIRLDTFTLPSGQGYTAQYSSLGNSHHESASLVTRIKRGISPDPLTNIVRYEYNGVGQVVLMDYPVPGVHRDNTLSSYSNYDRFDRVTTDRVDRDLPTDVAIHHIEIEYDRNSKVVLLEDQIHAGFDRAFTMDGLNRMTDAREGTWDGSGIVNETRHEEWSFDQSGNVDITKRDLNGDGDWSDPLEHHDSRTHSDANETTNRDTNNDGTNDVTLTYDSAGNLTDDGAAREYIYDPWYRLREIRNQSGDLLIEYRHNGVGRRIAEHRDMDDDGDVDASDEWRHIMNDEEWREVAVFVGSDTVPTEEWLHHRAGVGGRGTSSYIDEVASWRVDSTGDGRLDKDYYIVQNKRFDVVAVVEAGGKMLETVRYSAYGVPFASPAGDADSDGDCDVGDTVDTDQIQSWIDTSSYDVRGDVNLDGVVDATDKTLALTGTRLGWSVLSGVGNSVGMSGRPWVEGGYEIRHRRLDAGLGVWTRRDPLEYVDGGNLYEYVSSDPLGARDPYGLMAEDQQGEDPEEKPKPDPPHAGTGKIPRCPKKKPGRKDIGDGWCRDCYTQGDPDHHCGLECYRSYGSGTKGGQQCCYDKKGDLVDENHPDLSHCMGSIDLVSPADGEHHNNPRRRTHKGAKITHWPSNAGCCTWSKMAALAHRRTDVQDSKVCKDYDKVQSCMRDLGVPSGDASGEVGGITDRAFRGHYYTCMRKHGCAVNPAWEVADVD